MDYKVSFVFRSFFSFSFVFIARFMNFSSLKEGKGKENPFIFDLESEHLKIGGVLNMGKFCIRDRDGLIMTVFLNLFDSGPNKIN